MLEKIIVKIINPDLSITNDKTDNTYFSWRDNVINLGADYAKDDNGFLDHIYRVHKFSDVNKYKLSLWTILHEIGHYETFDVDESEAELKIRAVCAIIPVEYTKNNIEIRDTYFNLTREYEATEWAIEYVEQHPKLCKIFSFFLKG